MIAVIIAIVFNAERRREVLGLDIGISEAGLMWTEFLRKWMRRGLRGVKLVVSDAMKASRRRSQGVQSYLEVHRVHFRRNALAHAGQSGGG